MRFLRDERGELLILTPRDSVSPTGVPRSVPAAPAKAASQPSAPQPRRPDTQHCRFFCQWCGATILLQHDRIGMPFGAPYLRKIEVRSIGAVCNACNHVSNFSLFRGSPGYDTRNGLVPAEPREDVVLIDWLKCKEETCSYPLPLFLQPRQLVSLATIQEIALQWHWKELTCQMGHRIVAPPWVFGRAPYQFPAPIR
ncbi:MAG TPA: hypothetical protein VN151_12620 [Terracidiphilus sp.]|nr:hypothetical protein [Terracidiphilus sp.]